MVAMMLTALSYGRLAALYPSSGSAYSYVSGAFNPIAGYIVGWAMFLDYLIIPIVSSIYAALTLSKSSMGLMPISPIISNHSVTKCRMASLSVTAPWPNSI